MLRNANTPSPLPIGDGLHEPIPSLTGRAGDCRPASPRFCYPTSAHRLHMPSSTRRQGSGLASVYGVVPFGAPGLTLKGWWFVTKRLQTCQPTRMWWDAWPCSPSNDLRGSCRKRTASPSDVLPRLTSATWAFGKPKQSEKACDCKRPNTSLRYTAGQVMSRQGEYAV